MAYQLLGLNELEVHKINNHLSSGSTGLKYHGLTLDAISNGLFEGFQGKALTLYAAGTYTVTAAANQALAKNKTYVIENASQNLFVATTNSSGVGAPDFDTGAGIPDAASTNHSVFRALCKDETSTVLGPIVVIDQGDILWIPASNNFKFGFEVAAWNNRTEVRTKVVTQIGVMGAVAATRFVLTAAGLDGAACSLSAGNFLHVELSGEKAFLCHGNNATVTRSGPVDVPSGAFTCIVEYVAATNQAHLYVDGSLKASATLSSWSTASAMQFFMRAGQSTSYVQATSAPLDISIDSILVSCPRSMS